MASNNLNGEAVVITDAGYPNFADVAQDEGFSEIAIIYRKIAEVEKRHETRYRKLAKNVEDDTVFIKKEAILWECTNCGYIFEGSAAPNICPACAHPKAYFEIFTENY